MALTRGARYALWLAEQRRFARLPFREALRRVMPRISPIDTPFDRRETLADLFNVRGASPNDLYFEWPVK